MSKTPSYPPVDLTNCVLYLPGLPGYGSTIKDYSGEDNNGIIYGPTWKRLNSGVWYLDFDKVDDRIVVPDAASLRNLFDGGGTFELWMNPRSDGATTQGFVFYKIGNWILMTEDDDGSNCELRFLCYFDGDDGNWVTTAKDVTLSAWQHVKVTYNADATTNDPVIEINRVSKALTEESTPTGTRDTDKGSDVYIGMRNDLQIEYDGGMALKRMYSAIVPGHYQEEKHLFGV